MTLEHVSPDEAVQLYVQDRKPELSQSTVYEHRTRLRRFTEWASDDPDVEMMADMTRQKAYQYKAHRTDEVAPSTLENEMRTFRLFLRFCENFGCSPNGVAASLRIPTAPKSKRSRDIQLEPDNAAEILEYFERFEYCSFRHVMFSLMWNLGARISGIRALDLDDFHETSPDGPFVNFVHRPETGTPLKNGWKSERKPAIRDEMKELLLDYIEARRHDVTDDHGREPLLTTKQGRPVKTTIQRNIYGVTRPCFYTDECPLDREISECDAANSYNAASKCPDSRSPHTLRRGRATENANDGMPEEMICDRMDMSPDVFREHYRQQTEDDKRALQRKFLDQ
jgi:site-specific recombinase XerD